MIVCRMTGRGAGSDSATGAPVGLDGGDQARDRLFRPDCRPPILCVACALHSLEPLE